MIEKIHFIDGNELTEEQLKFIAKKDIKIPAKYNPDFEINEKNLAIRLELLKSIEQPYFFQVAIFEKKIVGFHIVATSYRLSHKVANTLTLWVDPSFRKKGIAKELKTRSEQWAINQGYPFIQTQVSTKNKRMLEINSKNGFSLDMYLMKKKFAANANTEVQSEKYQLPTFETERLILKALTLNDADNYQKYFSDYEVLRNLSTAIPFPYPKDGASYYLKNIAIPMQGKNRWSWGIYLKSKPSELIGCIDIFKRSERGNRGFWLAQKYWKQGLMTEAVKPIQDFAFLHLGFEKMIFENALGNIASRRIKEKTGATFLGTIESLHIDPKENISEQWELTRSNWLKYSRPSFVGNYSDYCEEDNSHYPGSSELLSIGSPIGKKLGLKKIGIHIETLLPGRRTSWPHAESKEEEFVYVLEGNPQVWLNGHLCDLKKGDMVAFPAGTGIAHTVINNTLENVLLLVGGLANIKSNKVFYPLHPNRNQEIKERGTLWEDHPKAELGPHQGLPENPSSR